MAQSGRRWPISLPFVGAHVSHFQGGHVVYQYKNVAIVAALPLYRYMLMAYAFWNNLIQIGCRLRCKVCIRIRVRK